MASQQNLYESPVAEITVDKTKAGWILIILAVILSLSKFGLSFFEALARTNDIAYSTGSGLSGMILALIVVALFQIGKKFRNSRSRFIIFNSVLAITLISGILKFVTLLATSTNV